MKEQYCAKEFHALLNFEDIIGNQYYIEKIITEEQEALMPEAVKALTAVGKQQQRKQLTSRQVVELTAEIMAWMSDEIANACANDFDRAAKLLAAVRKISPDGELNGHITTAIKEIALFRNAALPFALSPQKASKSIKKAIDDMPPPVKTIRIRVLNNLKWEYLNKRRSADYAEQL